MNPITSDTLTRMSESDLWTLFNALSKTLVLTDSGTPERRLVLAGIQSAQDALNAVRARKPFARPGF
jgi:hypothetical protein